MELVVATWNIHGWVGADGRHDPDRALRVIRRLDADVVALQEVTGTDWERTAAADGYEVVRGITRSDFGNALLLRVPCLDLRRVEISLPGRERRGALDAVLETRIGRLRIVTTHLGLRVRERRQQVARLANHLAAQADLPVVLAGDFNDWSPWAGQLRPLARRVGRFSRMPTFPSRRPLFALDRVACTFAAFQASVVAERSAEARVASDHLPLRMRLERRESDPEHQAGAVPRRPSGD